MDYANYVKGKYMQMALKGKRLPFGEEWESAIIATQCIFTVNSSMNNNALKLLQGIPDAFMEDFSNGKPVAYNETTRRYLESFLRAQNYMNAISLFTFTNIPPLLKIILENKDKIDPAIYKYFVGNKAAVEKYAGMCAEQSQAITNSINASLRANKKEIEELKMELAPILDSTQTDLNNLMKRFVYALNLQNVIKV